MKDNQDDIFTHAREKLIAQLRAQGISDEHVLEVMAKVPRHRFVPRQELARAYENGPLIIGHGQTVSQPYIVALMTQTLRLSRPDRVLEVGTGSGYQTAILAELVQEVYTIERLQPLSETAEAILSELGYTNINFCVGDGTLGWPEDAPFDAIIVTAAAPHIAEAWKEQLAEGGRIVAPVGSRYGQTLIRSTKQDGRFVEEPICGCVFVPLLGEQGWKEEGQPNR